MSTKTTIKRIALVAAVAAVFGGLSTVAANAVAGDTTLTFALGTVSATPKVLVAQTIPITITESGTANTASTGTLKAELTTKPAASALDRYSAVSVDATVFSSALTTAGVTYASTTAYVASTSGPILNVAATSSASNVGPSLAANFNFTPDVPGYYVVTFTKGGSASTAFTTSGVIGINVSGAALVQAATGNGTATGTQVAGLGSAATFWLPYGSTTASHYVISASGASITSVLAMADQADSTSAVTATSPTGVTKINGVDYSAGVNYVGALSTTSIIQDGSSHTDGITVQFTSPTASTAVVTVSSVSSTTGATTKVASVTVTFGAVGTVSPSLTTAYLGTGNACAVTAASSVPNIVKTAGVALTSTATTGASICINVKDTSGNALIGQAISASVAGPGLITIASGNGTASTGTVRATSLSAATQVSSSQAVIGISADGTAGLSTITITVGGVTLAPVTVNFYGSVATLTVTQNLFIARAGAAGYDLGTATSSAAGTTAGTTPAVVIVAKDSNGDLVPGLTITSSSSDTTVISSTTVNEEAGATSTIGAAGPGNYIALVHSAPGGVSGKTATVTFKTPNPADSTGATYITATPLTFTLGGSAATGTETITLDAATYDVGAPVALTQTAKDSAGNPVYDGVASPAVVFSKAMGGEASIAASYYVKGVVTSTTSGIPSLYAPSTAGAFTASETTAAGTNATATATVNPDASTAASNSATDAANQATDAANNAIDAANAAADTAQTAADAAQSAADTATQALAAAQSADQNATAALAAASEATDAGNAATDAANAAADSADAATAAAQDASAKAAAALAAVTQLSSQFTTLAAQVAKVLTAVQAIAKATTPAKKK